MIVMSDGGGLWELIKSAIGWKKHPGPTGPPVVNTADMEHVSQTARDVKRRVDRSQKAFRNFAERQQRELDEVRDRVANLTAEIDVLRRESS